MKQVLMQQPKKYRTQLAPIDFNKATAKGNTVPPEKRKHNPKFLPGQPTGMNF